MIIIGVGLKVYCVCVCQNGAYCFLCCCVQLGRRGLGHVRGNYEEGARLEIFSILVLVQYDFICVQSVWSNCGFNY